MKEQPIVATSTPSPLLRVRDVHRNFGGLQALTGCTLDVFPGEICALVGPNGAGKSTLVSCVAGSLPVTSGQIFLDDKDVTRMPTYERARLGLVRTFQLSQEWPGMTVLENVLVAAADQEGETLWSALVNRRRLHAREREIVAKAREILAVFGLDHMRDDLAGTLSGGQKRLLELARVAMSRARIAFLDEPMAGINPSLRDRIIQRIRDLRTQGVTFVVIEHNLGIVGELCERVVVLAGGAVIAEGTLEELRQNTQVVEAYLGVANA